MVSIDSRSFVSNIAIADLIAHELADWELEFIDYVDARGVKKRNIVASNPESESSTAFTGHLDTVPDTGWTLNPFELTQENGRLYGLGTTDMKGPVAAFVTAAKSLKPSERPILVFTADEEIGKQGVREVVARSEMLNRRTPKCFVVAEPTDFRLVRGHRVDIQFIVHAKGLQAHSSTGKGRNANLDLVPFLSDLRGLYFRLRNDTSLHDTQYDPPFCDLNFVIDNYGTVANTTAALATCLIKFRYSKSFNPEFVMKEIRDSAAEHDLELTIKMEAPPPELDKNNPFVQAAERILGCCSVVSGLGTEASEYSKLAPCLIYGPGLIECCHMPTEYLEEEKFYQSIKNFTDLALQLT
jgi:acetylornithine deacetylase